MNDNQELTEGAGGVVEGQGTGGQEGAGATVPVAATAEGAPAIAGTEAPAEKREDLTEREDFRRWQAARDRQETQLRQELTDASRQREEMQRELMELRLKDADPEELAAYYQQRVEVLEQGQQQAAVAAQERDAIVQQGQELLRDLGLEPNTPGLEWSDTPSWDGLARLAASAAKIKALQLDELGKQQGAVATAAAQQALEQAGVTRVSTATGIAPSAGENPIKDIEDADELLRMGLKAGRRG